MPDTNKNGEEDKKGDNGEMNQRQYSLDVETARTLLDTIYNTLDELKALIDEAAEEVDPEADPDAQDYNAANAGAGAGAANKGSRSNAGKGAGRPLTAIEARLADTNWELLLHKRKALPGDREAYNALIETKGLDFARDHFEAKPEMNGPSRGGGVRRTPVEPKNNQPDKRELSVQEFSAKIAKMGLQPHLQKSLTEAAAELAKTGSLADILEGVQKYNHM